MADEFAKGLGILTAGLLGWMTFSGWYTTHHFDGPQLLGAPPENPDVYGQLALLSRDMLFWFAVLGALTFWVLIPAFRQVRDSLDAE